MVLRVRWLKQPDTMPLGCYRTKKTPPVYLTASRIAALIWEAVKKVRLGISAKELSKYSAHLLWVWVCVLLDEAGKSPDYIWKQLCWMGDSFWMYLHDTRIIQDAHCKALRALNKEILTLLQAQPTDIMQNVLMSEGTANADMGKYFDDMDWIIFFMYSKMIHCIRSLYSLFLLIRKTGNEPGPKCHHTATSSKMENHPIHLFIYLFLHHL
jgi:hypothetical protein